jgi:multidrug transporter EmrE-like cation transporter
VHWFWITLSAISCAAGEFFSKKFANDTADRGALAVLFAAYMLGTACWINALVLKNQLVVVGMVWVLACTLSTVFVGAVAFGEAVSLQQWIGVLLAIISVIILSLPS